VFTAPSEPLPSGRVFGGQVLGQATLAAVQTTAADRVIHSMHAYFVRPGDDSEPVELSVDRVHDGRSFSHRRVEATQEGRTIFTMTASFHTEEPGHVHQPKPPLDVADPESVPSAVEAAVNKPELNPFLSAHGAFDVRPIWIPGEQGHASGRQMAWMRATSRLPDDENLHRAALAYASDYVILDPLVAVPELARVRPRLQVVSLNHALWWHRWTRVDDWLLHVSDAPAAQSGRGLGRTQVFTRDGELVASSTQEALVRRIRT